MTTRGAPPSWFGFGRYPEGIGELFESIATKLRNARYEVVITLQVGLLGNLINTVGAITNSASEDANLIARAA